jgi:hypothetical protein
MKRTLQFLNELEHSGMLERYAIGGATGPTFYRHGLEGKWKPWTP